MAYAVVPHICAKATSGRFGAVPVGVPVAPWLRDLFKVMHAENSEEPDNKVRPQPCARLPYHVRDKPDGSILLPKVALCYHNPVENEGEKPSFDLAEVKELAADEDTRAIMFDATRDALALGFLTEDVWQTIADLELSDFYKSMPSDKKHGTMLDVYRPTRRNKIIYLKLQIVPWRGTLSKMIKVVSFKLK